MMIVGFGNISIFSLALAIMAPPPIYAGSLSSFALGGFRQRDL
ncbi:MAG: hypothetical protein ACOYXY_15005 [Thermodesulfobacteriota bacterium]